ncbi:hypothetical protein XarjCFBP7653_21235, partial [Xanthomonas arboricola]
PSAFVVLERLPITPNGKIDRNALPAPQAGAFHRRAHTDAETDTEARLQAVWSALLGHERISTTVDYFEAGGHSLLATRLVSGIRDAFGVELSLREIFQYPTIRAQAALIASRPRTSASGPRVGMRPERLPLSAAQQRLWFVSTGDDGDGRYGIGTALRLHGRLRVEALEGALARIQQRHEILRTTYHVDTEGAWQQIHPHGGATLDVLDWSSEPAGNHESRLVRLIAEAEERPFDLSSDPMLRATLVALADEAHVLVLTV